MIDIQKLAEQAEIDIDTDGDIWGSNAKKARPPNQGQAGK